jgi:dTDP-4-dehydrorhamnose 3,5-epimerase
MIIHSTPLEDCLVIEPTVYEDSRGFFLETFNEAAFVKAAGIKLKFVQDNHSRSRKGVLRGLHFQKTKPQGKLVRVSNGSVFDVAVDLRENSRSFGKWYGVKLSCHNKLQFWVPPGFAHGFLALEDSVDLQYKCTNYYDQNDEMIIKYNDPDLKIDWPKNFKFIVSDKDKSGDLFSIAIKK